MAIYTISDLHLPFGADKPMDIFKGWDNYTNRLETNWHNNIKSDDTVILPGDFCWALKLEDTLPDFKFLESLPGKKIISKGNHDLWWSTKSKILKFFSDNNIKSVSLLYNNAYEVEDKIIAGTRGWVIDETGESDLKILERELIRLQLSLDFAKNINKNDNEIIVFLHYAPIISSMVYVPIIEILKNYHIKRCYYGHIHLATAFRAFNGLYEGINFSLISCDVLKFNPKKI